jgi:hypothetical protein
MKKDICIGKIDHRFLIKIRYIATPDEVNMISPKD